jgi:hypothetical protein
VTDTEIATFLSRPPHPEQAALLRVIGASIVDPQGAEVEDEPPAANTRREWSDAELTELGNMLVRGLSIEEIARLLDRDRGDIQGKVVEIGRPAVDLRPPTLSGEHDKIGDPARLPASGAPACISLGRSVKRCKIVHHQHDHDA